ncbi:MAG: carbamoyl phosphate synthase small subunit [Oscillospiraceae bacterium]|nr:carbamoyl phosphate synthase small subunit [Oscillospiraceae bacterium]
MNKAYLILENGSVFEGESFGADVEAVGQLVFNTSVVGYIETLTDPSHFGEIVIQTFPLIGNYGMIASDVESSNVWLKAYIVREWCQGPSNFRCEGLLDAFLKSRTIPALCGIDTRAVTRIVRENGSMNAMVSKTKELTDAQWAALKAFKPQGGVAAVTAKAPYTVGTGSHKTALIDLGVKASTVKKFADSDCTVTVYPAFTAAEEILAAKPDGVIIAGGPGDPTELTAVADEVRKICESGVTVMATGLGHEVLAMSQGATIKKMHYAHCGSNQPVLDSDVGTVFVTSQSHLYTIDSLPINARARFVNCNDKSCEGLEYLDMNAFSVEFEPYGCAGANDANWLYTKFIDMMDGKGVID